jgi:two-component system LytT family response regulator
VSWRTLIVDDERLARVALREVLAERPDIEVVGEADCVSLARERVAALRPDLVFLDVQMPGGSGFELFRERFEPRVVFCTAYERFAVRAFEVAALDYLMKPVSREQVDRAMARLGGSSDASGVLEIDDLVSLREASAMRLVQPRDITFIQAADDYSEVHLAQGPSALVAVTLRRWEERLPSEWFVRIHRSSLVNLRHIESVRSSESGAVVVVRGGPELAVSRRMAGDVRRRLMKNGS